MKKLYYSISEVCSLVDEEQHILRYWEKEFDGLSPKKNRSGNRIYSDRDLNIVKTIKILIRKEMLSLRGARGRLKKILDGNNLNNFVEQHSDTTDRDNVQSNEERHKERIKKDKVLKIDRELLVETSILLKESLDYLKSI